MNSDQIIYYNNFIIILKNISNILKPNKITYLTYYQMISKIKIYIIVFHIYSIIINLH